MSRNDDSHIETNKKSPPTSTMLATQPLSYRSVFVHINPSTEDLLAKSAIGGWFGQNNLFQKRRRMPGNGRLKVGRAGK